MDRDMEYPLTEKERLLFQAVWQLLEEGMDVSRMKVSDITKKAGIGKGTAYEYFKSKEELIAKAMSFKRMSGLREISEIVEKQKGFRGKIEAVFDWLEKNGEKRYTLTNLLKLAMQSQEMAGSFQAECKKMMGDPGKRWYLSIIERLILAGREEGFISPEIKDAQAGEALISHALGYLAYLCHKGWVSELDSKDMKEFACQSVLKCLK